MRETQNRSKSEAARQNGAKSHGPITPEGKQRSSENAFAHGFRSSRTVVPGESQQAYDTLAEAYYLLFHPNDVYEHDLIRHIIDCRWRLRRAQQMESSSYTLSICDNQAAWEEKYEFLPPVHRMFLALSSDGNCAKSIDRCLLYEERFQRMGIRSYNALEKKRKGKNMPSAQALQEVEANVPSNFEMAPPPPRPAPQPDPEPEPKPQPIDPPVTIEPIAALENASPEALRELLHTDWVAFFKNSGKILSFVVLCLFLLALKLPEAARAAGVR